MDIGKKIAHYRKNKNITQDALAKQLGISNQAVSKWETNQSCPDIELLPRIADILEITLDELFDRVIIVPERSENSFDQTVNEFKKAEKEDLIGSTTTSQKTISLPWEDDEKLHAALFIGHRLVQKNELQDNENSICKEITFCYEGAARNIESAFNICCGDVQGTVTAGGYVECGDVGECVTAGTYVECGDVRGNITSQGYIECGDIQGNVSAGGNVCCGDIAGDVKVTGNIDCGDINGCVYKN